MAARPLNLADLAAAFDPIDLGPDELVDGAVLLVRTQVGPNSTRLVARSQGLDWLTRRGILDEALTQERQRPGLVDNGTTGAGTTEE